MTDVIAILKRKQESLTQKSIWTFAKQETSFENVFKAACIFASIPHPENENIEDYFLQHDFNGFKCNHRMLSSAQLFGLVTKTGNRYNQETVTPVFRKLYLYHIGSDEFNIIKTEQLLKIKMSAIIDRNDNTNTHHILPVFYIFDVLYALHLRGIESISTEQLFSYVMTCDSYDELHDTVEILSTNPLPSKYVDYYMGNSRMWTLIDKNCKLFLIKNGRVSINPNYIDFFYNHFYMNTKNAIESILNSIIDYPEAYSKALTNYQNLDIDLTQDTPRAFVRFKDDMSTLGKLQVIYYGAPGTGKSHKIKNNENVKSAEEKNLVFRTTFHPDSDYSTFVGAYKPMMDKRAVRNVAGDIVKNGKEEVYEDSITYSFVPQSFLQAYVAAWNNPDDKVFLVIEEINRGNCAQIFGDLFQLLDRDEYGCSEYPIVADKDLAKYLKEGKDENGQDVLTNKDGIKDGKLKLPNNLYIWATMNTSDQSLFPIDSAFKRRWDWVYMPIDTKKENWFIKVGEKRYSWTAFLEKINNEILTDETAEDKHLGFYFCKAENNEILQELFVGKVLFYLWNDVFKVYGIPTVIGSSKDWAYTKFYYPDGNVNEQKVKELMKKLQIAPVGNGEENSANAEEKSDEQ